MASLKESGMGIGDFAQKLLEHDVANPKPAPKPKMQGNVPDIENVQVLQEDVNDVLANSFGIRRDPVPQVNLEEEKRKQLKEEIKVKVKELKDLLAQLPLEEITGVGNVGFGGYGRLGKTYKASTKRKRRPR